MLTIAWHIIEEGTEYREVGGHPDRLYARGNARLMRWRRSALR
jgi:hypothetical protein